MVYISFVLYHMLDIGDCTAIVIGTSRVKGYENLTIQAVNVDRLSKRLTIKELGVLEARLVGFAFCTGHFAGAIGGARPQAQRIRSFGSIDVSG